MRGKKRISHPLWRGKIVFTLGILIIYLIGRMIPLYGIDTSEYTDLTMDAQSLLTQVLNGDRNQQSVFALGISPHIVASMGLQLVLSCMGKEVKRKASAKKINSISAGIMLVTAMLQAFLQVGKLKFMMHGYELYLAQMVAGVEMVAGAFIILWLCERNKKFGIGGQTLLIFVNILDGLLRVIQQNSWNALQLPLIVSAIVVVIVIFMDSTEFHIPVQRITIQNIYADQDYIAFKLIPIGIMPVMYASAFFMIPNMIANLLHTLFPANKEIAWCLQELTMRRPLGIGVYLGGLLFLTIFFANIFLSPDDMAEQLLQGGDSVIGLHSGKETGRYFRRVIVSLSIWSAIVTGACIGVPLVLSLIGLVDPTLAMMPSSMMMLAGMYCNLYQESKTIESYDEYQPFI